MSRMNQVLRHWVRALRAYSFSATILPVVCAFLLANRSQSADWSLCAPMLLCALLLHAGVNLLNDYYDFILGFDTVEARGSSGLLTAGLVSPGWMLGWGRFYLLAGAGIGLALVAVRGPPLLLAGSVGVVGAWFYSHRHGYKYKGWGEPCVFLLMGPLLFGGSFYVATGRLTATTIAPALACGCLVAAILLVNNLRDLEMDSSAGFVTLPMKLGALRSRQLYAGLLGGAVIAVVAGGILPPLLCLPLVWRQAHRVQRAVHLSTELATAPQKTAQLYLLFGILLAIGLSLPQGSN